LENQKKGGETTFDIVNREVTKCEKRSQPLNHGEICTMDLASVVYEVRPVVTTMVTLMKIREEISYFLSSTSQIVSWEIQGNSQQKIVKHPSAWPQVTATGHMKERGLARKANAHCEFFLRKGKGAKSMSAWRFSQQLLETD
jgi:hypothetical protein